ncbi:MAG: inosine monophosphate cyclohydrolase [Kiritimatiellae bacterium]|nr:inosine monophosphate cyclohydrolase [Kiritimatiellia bacterium]
MQIPDLFQAVSATRYPGRGIFCGRDASGGHALLAYFIMGRSANSRNRVFVPHGADLEAKAFDESRVEDPRLILYFPVRVLPGGATVVTNGDQTDTVADFLRRGATFEEALRTRTFEPDAPNFTPRISALVRAGEGTMSFQMSILKTDDGGETPVRAFFDYPGILPGTGRFLHTYQGDGTPLPSFAGEPEKVSLDGGDLDAFASSLWDALDGGNKISLWVRRIRLAGGETEDRLFNRNA